MDVATQSPTSRLSRRELGSYYTPRFIVRRMLRDCLREGFQTSSPFRILDPACGDGAFLLEAFDLLDEQFSERQRNPEYALQIVREYLFGVDVDATAVRTLRKRLFRRINPQASLEEETRRILRSNLRCGDALTGPDFSTQNNGENHGSGLNWRTAFPRVADVGGFDLVIGNPPYRRELHAAGLFEQVASTPLGKSWRQARMDYWYYFLHRGLDLLKAFGRLSFIVNSYWTASSGATKLIGRLKREATLEDILLLGDAPVFADVSGRHMIFRLQKGRSETPCRVTEVSLGNSLRTCEHRIEKEDWNGAVRVIPQQQIYREGRLTFSKPDHALSQIRTAATLGESYEMRQGMAENPPCINRRHVREFGDRFQPGEGVFVLTAEEIDSLNLTSKERALLRPNYPTSTVRRFDLTQEPARFVLYLTKQTAPTLEGLPQIKRHLSRFRPILERRRETRKGTLPWWCLHWPREERIFTRPRILCTQMGKVPQFVFVERPAFVGFSVNIILQKSAESFSLQTLTGILNSTLAFRWFRRHAKRRGVNLEINGNHLKQFPFPRRNPRLEGEIEALVIARQAVDREDLNRDRTLDRLVCRLYGVAFEEVCSGLSVLNFRVEPNALASRSSSGTRG